MTYALAMRGLRLAIGLPAKSTGYFGQPRERLAACLRAAIEKTSAAIRETRRTL